MLREHPRYEKTAIIFISAIHLSDLDRIRGYETGAVDYVPVPVIPEILRAKVKIFAELYRKTRQLEKLNDELERRVAERTAELEASTAQLRESEERLRLASEAAGFGTYDYNAAAGQVYWSPDLRRIVGLARTRTADIRDGARLRASRAPRDGPPAHAGLRADRRAVATSSSRSSGPTARCAGCWTAGQAVPREQEPMRLRVIGTILDITERKRHGGAAASADGRARPSREEHPEQRVGASPVFRVTARTSVDAFVDALDGRIQAMSRAHALLRRGAWAGADLPS